MSLFEVTYTDVPGDGVYTEGGLKFRASEETLENYFSPILDHVPLSCLLGEALFWTKLPQTTSIWLLPFVLYFFGWKAAFVGGLAAYFVTDCLHRIVYIKAINYLVFVGGNRFLQLVYFAAAAAILYHFGQVGQVYFLLGLFLFFAWWPAQLLVSLITLLPYSKIFSLPQSDQALRNVGWRYGAKLGKDPLKWEMW